MPDNHLARPGPPEVVLDTNVVLDWLLFNDPSVQPLSEAITSGSWHWVGTADTLRELATVLSRQELDRWRPVDPTVVRTALNPLRVDPAHEPGISIAEECDHPALATARRLCKCVTVPAITGMSRLVCTDGEDQKFIDLAMGRRVRWLFSRDKAVLRLARRARPFGVTMLRPADWTDALIEPRSIQSP